MRSNVPTERADAQAPSAPSKPKADNVEKVNSEMQKVMSPFVHAMGKEFTERWPHLDPELALLKFLCEQRNIEPPDVSIASQPRPKAGGSRSRRYEPAPVKCAGAEEVLGAQPENRSTHPALPEVRGVRSDSGPASSTAKDGQAAAAYDSQSTSRPPSSLSYYKGSRPNSSQAVRRPESAVSTRYADTPFDEVGVFDDVLVSREDLDKLEWHDTAYARKQTKTFDEANDGRFIDFPLPPTPIDQCPDTPYIIRRSNCLTDRIAARREEAAAALGKPGLKSLARIQAMAEKDFLISESRHADTKTDGFAARIATVRQGLRGEFISKVPLLSLEVVNQEEQFWLVGKLVPTHYTRGQKIFVEGETGDKLFIVEGGTCLVTKEVNGERQTLCDFKPGDSFGDMAVMYDMPRTATVTAATAVKLLSLSRDDIFSTVCPESLDRMRARTRLQLLLTTPALAAQSREHQMQLLNHMRADVFRPGREIMREGWRSGGNNRRVYIVERGTCSQVRKDTPGVENLAPGTNFGNMEFAFGCPQQSTVVATTEVAVISVGYEEMKELLGEETEVALQLMQRFMRLRLLRDAHAELLEQDLCRDKDEQTLGDLLDRGTFQQFSAWQPIVKKGDPVTHLMMLDSGICIEHGESLPGLTDSTLESATSTEHSCPGDTFETHRLVGQQGAVAPYTLVAISDVSVFFLPADILLRLPERRKTRLDGRSSVIGRSSVVG